MLIPIASRKKEMDMEVRACTVLDLKNGHMNSLIQCELFTMMEEDSASKNHFSALLMPRYVTTLAEMAPLCEVALLHGLNDMIIAVEYVHSQNLVHMDIKGDNIFIDGVGKWLLGDFGSCKFELDDITSFTRYFLPEVLQKAVKSYDWYLLGVTIVVQLCKSEWKEKLCSSETSVISHELVIRAARNVAHDPLRKLLLSVFLRGHMPLN